MMYTRTLFRLLLLPLLLSSLYATADHLRPHLLLSAKLEGAQEVPAVSTAAQGVASFTFNENRDTLFITASFTGLSGPITGAHVHEGARGVAGPVVTNLMQFVRGNRMQGFLTGPDIERAKLARYLRGRYYINVHTAANPGGEIRGQLELEQDYAYVASLSGGQETPPVTTTASGLGVFTLARDKSRLRFHVVVRGLSGAITGSHFHQAAPGAAGPVVVDLAPFRAGNVISGEITPSAAFLTAFEAGNIYINIHTAANPGGEIRGQVFRDANWMNLDARLSSGQMVPPVANAANGVAILRANYRLDTLVVFATYTGLTGPVTEVKLHNSPLGQANGPATPISNDLSALIQNEQLGVQLVPPTATANAFINAFLRGDVNLMFATTANPNGELRGQAYRLAREGYTFALSGSQERPTPTPSQAYGAGLVSIDRDQTNAHFMLSWGGLSGPITGAHFHSGLRTQAGPVVFNLQPFVVGSSTYIEGDWKSDATQPFTLRRSIQFRGDSIYANLHTAQFPGGEIRGQVFRGARNLSRVLATQPPAIVPETVAAYPNPAADKLTLRFEARRADEATVEVTDLLGRKVLQQALRVQPNGNQEHLTVSHLKAGTYFISINVSGTKIVTKFAKE